MDKAMTGLDAAAFVLLGMAMLAVWWPPVRLAQGKDKGRGGSVAPWALLWAFATAAGLAGGVLGAAAMISLAALIVVALWRMRALHSPWPPVTMGALSLALALHVLPGFHSPVLFGRVQISAGAQPFTLHANFDKATGGLFLLALCCRRSRSWREAWQAARRAWPLAALTVSAVLAAAWTAGLVAFDVKLLPQTSPARPRKRSFAGSSRIA